MTSYTGEVTVLGAGNLGRMTINTDSAGLLADAMHWSRLVLAGTMTIFTGAGDLGCDSGNNSSIRTLVTDVTRSMTCFGIGNFCSMTINTGQSTDCRTYPVGRGWLMFGAAMAIGTALLIEQRIASLNCRNDLRSCALMTGDAERMIVFGIGDFSGMTISTEQTANRRQDVVGGIVRAMTRSTGYRLFRCNGGTHFCSGTLMTGVTRHMIILCTLYFRSMAINAGGVSWGDIMLWGRLMLSGAMATRTGAGGLGGDGRNNCRIGALVTGGASGVTCLGIRNLSGMTIRAGQATNRCGDAMWRGWNVLIVSMARGTGASGLGGNSGNDQRIGTLVTGLTGGVVCFSVGHLSGMTIRAGQATNCRCDIVCRSWLMLSGSVAGRTGTRGLGCNGRHNRRIRALMTGLTSGMICLGVRDFTRMAISAGQATNRCCDIVGRSWVMLVNPMT